MDLRELSERSYALRGQIDEAKASLKKLNEEMDELEKQLLTKMKEEGITSFKSPHGTISMTHRFYAPFPKDPAKKQELINYMSMDTYLNFATIHSATFTSWVKTEMENAKEKGDINYKIPGVDNIGISESLSFRG